MEKNSHIIIIGILLIISSVVYGADNYRHELGGTLDFINTGATESERVTTLILEPIYNYYLSNNLFVGTITEFAFAHNLRWYGNSDTDFNLGLKTGFGIPIRNVFPYVSLGGAWVGSFDSNSRNYFMKIAEVGVKILPTEHIGLNVNITYSNINNFTYYSEDLHTINSKIGLFTRF
ncbi:MAG: porin family protein [Desulfocucumaceae bacterium]